MLKTDLKGLRSKVLASRNRSNFQTIHIHFRIVNAKIKVILRLKLWGSLMNLLEIIQNLLYAGSNYR